MDFGQITMDWEWTQQQHSAPSCPLCLFMTTYNVTQKMGYQIVILLFQITGVGEQTGDLINADF